MEESDAISSVKASSSNSSEDCIKISEIKVENLSNQVDNFHKDPLDRPETPENMETEDSPHSRLSSADIENSTERPCLSTSKMNNEVAVKTEDSSTEFHCPEKKCYDGTLKVEMSKNKKLVTSSRVNLSNQDIQTNMKMRAIAESLDLDKMDRYSRLRAAYEATRQGMSGWAASRMFKVTKKSLNNRISGRVSINANAKTRLTVEEETKFSNWAIAMARTGFARSYRQFTTAIQTYLNGLGEARLRFKNDNKPTKCWYRYFIKRHPELSLCSSPKEGRVLHTIIPAEDDPNPSSPSDIPPTQPLSTSNIPAPSTSPSQQILSSCPTSDSSHASNAISTPSPNPSCPTLDSPPASNKISTPSPNPSCPTSDSPHTSNTISASSPNPPPLTIQSSVPRRNPVKRKRRTKAEMMKDRMREANIETGVSDEEIDNSNTIPTPSPNPSCPTSDSPHTSNTISTPSPNPPSLSIQSSVPRRNPVKRKRRTKAEMMKDRMREANGETGVSDEEIDNSNWDASSFCPLRVSENFHLELSKDILIS